MSKDKTESSYLKEKLSKMASKIISEYDSEEDIDIISKADAKILNEEARKADPTDFFYSKALDHDYQYRIHSQGFIEKPYRLEPGTLKAMRRRNHVVSAIIQTRQAQVYNFSELSNSVSKTGFRIRLKDENFLIKKIIEEIKSDLESKKNNDNGASSLSEQEVSDFEIERQARDILEETTRDKKKFVEEFMLNCGRIDNRPFNTKKWTFGSCLKAWVNDRYTYDLMATEIVPDNANRIHHFQPIDGGTVRYATPDLKRIGTARQTIDREAFLYPELTSEKTEETMREKLSLDEELLEKNAYRWVQVHRGKPERYFTEDELKVGMYNLTTDIYDNGYPLSELELLVNLITSHLHSEYYNQAYYTQGFSAKGILHIQAKLSRRNVERIRQQWHHMIRGGKNSFQTPIFAGTDKVEWIPLTQNHSDIEFQGWMNYIIKLICAVFQIDPQEIGFGIKEAGSRGSGGLQGDNTEEKIIHSKDRGLRPLLKYLQNYINKNIIDLIDSDFYLEFTGLDAESPKELLERQKMEAEFKKTVNEIRLESGLTPIPGGDDLILNPLYYNWLTTFSEKALEHQQEQMEQQAQMEAQAAAQNQDQVESPDIKDQFPTEESEIEDLLEEDAADEDKKEKTEKSLNLVVEKLKKAPIKIEYYNINEKDDK